MSLRRTNIEVLKMPNTLSSTQSTNKFASANFVEGHTRFGKERKMSANKIMAAIGWFFGRDQQGTHRALKTNPENDNAGRQPGGVGKTNNSHHGEHYAMHRESASIWRQVRLLQALLINRSVSRHDLDELLGAENSPDIVMRLRRKFGFELPCERGPMIDPNGLLRHVGYYWLSSADIPMAHALLTFGEYSEEFVMAQEEVLRQQAARIWRSA